MPKRTREDEAGPSTLKLPPLMGMDDEAGSASWGRKEKRSKKKEKKEGGADVEAGGEGDAGAKSDGDVEDGEKDHDDTRSETSSVQPKPKKKKKTVTPGVVYISRLPPGMTPHKVRHLMSRWGETGRVYAQRRDGESECFS